MQTPPATPTKKKLSHDYWVDCPTEYFPYGRRDLSPIFELVAEMSKPTFVQKSYYGRKRHSLLIKAEL